MSQVSKYEPSAAMLHALELEFSDEILTKTDATFRSYLEHRQLNYENAISVLRMLLSIEDLSTLMQYSQIMQFDVPVQLTKAGRLSIKLSQKANQIMLVPLVDEVVLLPVGTLSASEQPIQRIPKLFNNVGRVFVVTNVTKECVIIEPSRFSNVSPKSIKNTNFDVIFRSPRIPFRVMYLALNRFTSDPKTRRYLFPHVNTPKISSNSGRLSLINADIQSNPEQLEAIQQIVAGPNPEVPYILFGPPGTGKTTTIVEAILQVYLTGRGRILVSIGSNAACDVITLKLIQHIEKDKRLQSLQSGESGLLRLISATQFKKHVKSIHPAVLKYSNYEENRRKKTKSRTGLKKIDLAKYKIVVATLCLSGLRAARSLVKFTHIFIDEAASVSEPETLLAIAGIKNDNCHVILSGDHQQLGPVVKSKRAKSLGLDHSAMERLLLHKMYEVNEKGQYDRTVQSRLRRSYRAHPEIIGLYNKLFYNGNLIPMAPMAQVNQAANWSMLADGKFPILFQATHGETEIETNSTSSFNMLEAQMVCWYVLSLLKDGLGGVKVEQNHIGIVTPYLAQYQLLKRMLRVIKQESVEVGTVERFQGREKPIMIASLVSSFSGASFLSNPRRINVLLSRAKLLLILIGNPITLGKNQNFKFIIDQCKAHGNVQYKMNKIKDDSIVDLLKNLKLQDIKDEEMTSSQSSLDSI
ncbi:putative helicase mov-10-B.1 [Drosophila hydei]|uniref:Helicase mov-10-B.1 n=1 Tax=Drosophila hydei TaxID=7224 RepID=A0A6J1LGX2_DROHY|nr:putative helicase mov-10-B.1 [Drosophila hydei]